MVLNRRFEPEVSREGGNGRSMRFMAAAATDRGNFRNINQDSLLLCHGWVEGRESLLAAVCDGMGGLAKGELASAAVVRTFFKWYQEELPQELKGRGGQADMQEIGARWSLMLKRLNARLSEYAGRTGLKGMGTTFSGLLFLEDQYVIVHVGDSRVYWNGPPLRQLTQDHTCAAREVSRGRMTGEQARKDPRRNQLLQCVGASPFVEPQVIGGGLQAGLYLLCSDGFYHELGQEELAQGLDPARLADRQGMEESAHYLIERVRERGERDNISVILIRVL